MCALIRVIIEHLYDATQQSDSGIRRLFQRVQDKHIFMSTSKHSSLRHNLTMCKIKVYCKEKT